MILFAGAGRPVSGMYFVQAQCVIWQCPRRRLSPEQSLRVRARGGVVVVAHRPNAIAGVDLVLVMSRGRVQPLTRLRLRPTSCRAFTVG